MGTKLVQDSQLVMTELKQPVAARSENDTSVSESDSKRQYGCVDLQLSWVDWAGERAPPRQ